ncbi:hypothetical protein CMV30_12585 [Nibricoccus aquaticus]|uniref:Uncharacterized protein n=1 Tax=Nibricoccus aquaticus TaxID=2576891 RepID=A0A290Q7V3_9BACT|nr:hypothetical protein CMV30_12585 [Nibricoccus aquaticus]
MEADHAAQAVNDVGKQGKIHSHAQGATLWPLGEAPFEMVDCFVPATIDHSTEKSMVIAIETEFSETTKVSEEYHDHHAGHRPKCTATAKDSRKTE